MLDIVNYRAVDRLPFVKLVKIVIVLGPVKVNYRLLRSPPVPVHDFTELMSGML